MIYFLQGVGGGPIKIGTTIRLSDRLKTLAKEAGQELRVLAVVSGSYKEERSIHRKFAHLQVLNEWFEPGDDLLGFVIEECLPWDGKDEVPVYLSVKLHMDVIESARVVAAFENESMTDLLSTILRPILAKREDDALAKRTKARGKGGPK